MSHIQTWTSSPTRIWPVMMECVIDSQPLVRVLLHGQVL